ncbi:Transcriptional regulatory protein SEF1 [Talaromyces islandicus]|uniref:Transcriptional regulatory protein SEF1 n=1 Tax=Talaromyces islandicus TaxID=28573 RepID=A0A0U1M4D5_TALIS|nr:Transcriptional regulatory protein SEF1 [Talaromyces islandicus]
MSSHQLQGGGAAGQQSLPAPQLNRSCESCRALKVRCLPDVNMPNQCQRCTKAKRPCIFVAPQRRRPRKRTDSRVAQLEKEMAAMRSMLKDQRAAAAAANTIKEDIINEESDSGRDEEEPDEADFGLTAKEKQHPINYQEIKSVKVNSTSQSPGIQSAYDLSGDGHSIQSTPSLVPHSSSPDFGDGGDIVDRGLISPAAAEDLLSLFMTDLLDYFPFIVLPVDTTAAQLRHSKPVLFLAIIAAAAIAVDAGLANVMNHEIISLYSQRFFFRGEKSLEMVQALILMNIYYLPPDSPSQIQAYQYSHIAATMAIEVGIAYKKRMPRKPNRNRRQATPAEKFDDQMAEQARTILTCYHLASTVAMRTRRPNMLQYNDWIKECVRMLSQSPIDSDRRLAIWFELQIITDEALSSFGLDDTASTAPLTETRVNAVLRLFDKKMDDWKDSLDAEDLTVPMVLEYQHALLSIYELGIGEGYREPDAIKRTYYTLPAPESGEQQDQPLSALRIDLNVKWLNAAQGLLDSFLNCDVHTMRKMPNLTYSRVVLGVMVLLKIFFSVKSGALREVIGPDTVSMEQYLKSMTERLTEASAGSKYPIPSRWLHVVGGKARDWLTRFENHRKEKEAQAQAQTQLDAEAENTAASAAAVVGPSTSSMTAAWHGGIVPTPTKLVPPGMQPAYPDDYRRHHQQQQQLQHEQAREFNPSLGYSTTNASPVASMSATSTPVHNYSHNAWPAPTQSDPGMHHQHQQHQNQHRQHHPHMNNPAAVAHHYTLPSQPATTVWTFQHDMAHLQQTQSFPLDLGGQDASSHNNPMYNMENAIPMDMEFDWVPDRGMFQLPTF